MDRIPNRINLENLTLTELNKMKISETYKKNYLEKSQKIQSIQAEQKLKTVYNFLLKPFIISEPNFLDIHA